MSMHVHPKMAPMVEQVQPKASSDSVPFRRLLSYADPVDWTLMAFGRWVRSSTAWRSPSDIYCSGSVACVRYQHRR
ncbi:hypothetical protein QJS10_CPB11g01899 [Acorus calamus]|uniref:Uncharacterized protein n=1 Tax=Acorus calamus TaxID=4465 RepID=A0AAV9DQE4_ACOCL|nr:hypothetical protein QJS10_CPB11g01899 [Acorus calamus]